LLGPIGTGKTTLFKAIAGMLRSNKERSREGKSSSRADASWAACRRHRDMGLPVIVAEQTVPRLLTLTTDV